MWGVGPCWADRRWGLRPYSSWRWAFGALVIIASLNRVVGARRSGRGRPTSGRPRSVSRCGRCCCSARPRCWSASPDTVGSGADVLLHGRRRAGGRVPGHRSAGHARKGAARSAFGVGPRSGLSDTGPADGRDDGRHYVRCSGSGSRARTVTAASSVSRWPSGGPPARSSAPGGAARGGDPGVLTAPVLMASGWARGLWCTPRCPMGGGGLGAATGGDRFGDRHGLAASVWPGRWARHRPGGGSGGRGGDQHRPAIAAPSGRGRGVIVNRFAHVDVVAARTLSRVRALRCHV